MLLGDLVEAALQKATVDSPRKAPPSRAAMPEDPTVAALLETTLAKCDVVQPTVPTIRLTKGGRPFLMVKP